MELTSHQQQHHLPVWAGRVRLRPKLVSFEADGVSNTFLWTGVTHFAGILWPFLF